MLLLLQHKTFILHFTADLYQDFLPIHFAFFTLYILIHLHGATLASLALLMPIFNLMPTKNFPSEFSSHIFNVKANQQPL